MKRCHQTKRACPLLDDPRLYPDIGSFGKVPQVETICDGMYVCPDDIDPEVKTFLRYLQLPPTVLVKETPNLIIFAAYRESWEIFKEIMSSKVPHVAM